MRRAGGRLPDPVGAGAIGLAGDFPGRHVSICAQRAGAGGVPGGVSEWGNGAAVKRPRFGIGRSADFRLAQSRVEARVGRRAEPGRGLWPGARLAQRVRRIPPSCRGRGIRNRLL